MNRKCILVTGIGGNVGQGVLRNIKALDESFKLIGTDISSVTAGNHLCDEFEQIPYAYTDSYISKVLEICEKYSVDLIIPTTDYEVYHLSVYKEKLPNLIANGEKSALVFLDKFNTWESFSKNGVPFANSFLPSSYQGELNEIIVKPRKGRGSRDLFINPIDLHQFDDSFMVQEYVEGRELTSAFYVTKSSDVIGPITFERHLENGATTKCWVNSEFDTEVREIMLKITETLDVSGPNNIQFRVSKEGEIVPFEINGRYSGTNSIRPHFGFNDVKMGVEEYLYGVSPKIPNIKNGTALRMLTDIIYPEINDLKEIGCNQDKYFYF